MAILAAIDTNVLVSAMLKKDSVPRKVVDKVLDGTATAIINDEILTEYLEVLSRPKFHFPSETIRLVIEGFIRRGIKFQGIPVPEEDGELPDAEDVVFYAVTLDARQRKEAYLVTGNGRHFPVKPFVVTPAQMLEVIEGKS